MSTSDVFARKYHKYKSKRDVAHRTMAYTKENKIKQQEADKLFLCDFNNMEVANLLDITYTEVIALRLSYERRCKK